MEQTKIETLTWKGDKSRGFMIDLYWTDSYNCLRQMDVDEDET